MGGLLDLAVADLGDGVCEGEGEEEEEEREEVGWWLVVHFFSPLFFLFWFFSGAVVISFCGLVSVNVVVGVATFQTSGRIFEPESLWSESLAKWWARADALLNPVYQPP